MSTTVELLESIIKFGGHQQLVRFLKSCDESRIFTAEIDELRAAIALTNRLLNENSSRRDGLLVLKCLLGQIPSDLLQANLFQWLQQALKGLSQKESSSTVILAADVINVLLPLSAKFPEIRKQTALNTVSKILEVLHDLKDSPEFVTVVLPCLLVVSKHYDKSASSWKEKLDKFVLGLIEEDEFTVQLAARCYLAWAASGPPGTDMVNYKENWTQQFSSLSSALHLVLDRLFENVNEMEQFTCGTRRLKPNFEVPAILAKVPYLRLSRLTTQFVNLCEFLKIMLTGPFPVGKRVVPEQLLSVACRGLAVTVQTLQAQVTSDTPGLIAQIPQLHASCLSLLHGLIISCQTNLITYGSVITKLIAQVLKSTDVAMAAYGQHKPYRSVRLSAYSCLSSWLTVASCSSGVEKHPELVNYIISDVQFKKPTVKLNMSSKLLKGKMGKKQRQALVNQTISKKEDHVADREANSDVCLAALNTIPPLLDSVSTLLPAKSHKDLQTAVCSELLITQLNSGERIPLPYSVKHCRLGLYKCFVAMCHNFHPSFPPPLSFASQLISGGLVDSFDEIVRFCTISLSSVDKMLRPIGATLSFPIEFPEMKLFHKKMSLDVSLCSTPSLTSTPRNVSGKTQENNGSATVNRSISSKLNGGDAPNVSELDINPILVDPDMSDFDFMSPPKNPAKPTAVGTHRSPSPSRDEALDLAKSDGSQTVSEPVALDSSKENGDSLRTLKLQNGDSSPKRKPDMISECQPSAKKVKSDLEEEPTNPTNQSDENIYTAATQNPFSGGSEVPSGKDTIAESTEKTLWPDDDMEEAMMSSFVDEVL